MEERPQSDHEPIISKDSKIISWNVQKDSSFMEIYSWDSKQNYFKNFSLEYINEINKIYGIGQNFRVQMESENKFEEFITDRYKKIFQKLKLILSENDSSNKNISQSKFRICLQECPIGLFDYLKKNFGFKHIKFISQDIDGISIGDIKNFSSDLDYIINWFNLQNDKKNIKEYNKLILNNEKWKEYLKKNNIGEMLKKKNKGICG